MEALISEIQNSKGYENLSETLGELGDNIYKLIDTISGELSNYQNVTDNFEKYLHMTLDEQIEPHYAAKECGFL
jgi:hypothetical protein